MGVETPNQNALSTICNNSEEIIEDVEHLCYRGSVITMDGGAEADVNSRNNKARHAFYRLNCIYAARNISINTNLRIFNPSVKPLLVYVSGVGLGTI